VASVALNGTRAMGGSLWLPRTGLWICDLQFESPEAASASGKVAIDLLGASLSGTVDAAFTGTFRTRGRVRVVGGIGWQKQLPARHFHNDALLKTAHLVDVTAGECGESVDASSIDQAARIGVDYVRRAGPGARLLDELFNAWRVELDGITRIGEWSDHDAAGGFDLIDYQPEARIATLALDSLLLPGALIVDRLDAPLRVRNVEVTIAEGKARATVWGIQ
jgi:hypothetical protein